MKVIKQKKIDKKKFKELIYGFNRNDLSDDIEDLTEGLIESENTLFYLISDVDVINKNCRCINPAMYPQGKVLPLPLSMFYPYIIVACELTTSGTSIQKYAKWGSFDDNLDKIFSEKDNMPERN